MTAITYVIAPTIGKPIRASSDGLPYGERIAVLGGTMRSMPLGDGSMLVTRLNPDGLPRNPTASTLAGKDMYGPALLVGEDPVTGDLTSLSDGVVASLTERFGMVEG